MSNGGAGCVSGVGLLTGDAVGEVSLTSMTGGLTTTMLSPVPGVFIDFESVPVAEFDDIIAVKTGDEVLSALFIEAVLVSRRSDSNRSGAALPR